MDRRGFQDWLDRYVAAWKSYDRDAIAELWSEDAEYRHHPEDEPGRYDGRYEVLAIDGQEHVAMGWSREFDERGELQDEYWNIYRCQFDRDGRCTLFTEWWIRDREFARRDRERPQMEGLGEASED